MRTPYFYVLNDDGSVRAARDIYEWGELFVEPVERRKIDETLVDDYIVSTVFLGQDHNWAGRGPPILFETMIFGLPEDDEYQRRYATIEEARRGHEVAIAWARAVLASEEERT